MRTPMISQVTLMAALSAALMLVACGQKGPLYLPQDPASPSTSSSTSGIHSHGQPGAVQTPQSSQDETESEQQTEQHTEAEAVTK